MSYVITDGGRFLYAPHERRDCTVRGLAIALNIPYHEAHGILKNNGRKDGHKYNFEKFMRENGASLNCKIVARSGTIGKFLQRFPQGRYLIRMRGHVFAIVDGRIHDDVELGLRCKVNQAWLIS